MRVVFSFGDWRCVGGWPHALLAFESALKGRWVGVWACRSVGCDLRKSRCGISWIHNRRRSRRKGERHSVCRQSRRTYDSGEWTYRNRFATFHVTQLDLLDHHFLSSDKRPAIGFPYNGLLIGANEWAWKDDYVCESHRCIMDLPPLKQWTKFRLHMPVNQAYYPSGKQSFHLPV